MLNAKAMLFIDHGKAQVVKAHLFLDQRGGADDNVDATITQAPQNPLPFGTGYAPGQQGDF